jgi:hypothetical protein
MLQGDRGDSVGPATTIRRISTCPAKGSVYAKAVYARIEKPELLPPAPGCTRSSKAKNSITARKIILFARGDFVSTERIRRKAHVF